MITYSNKPAPKKRGQSFLEKLQEWGLPLVIGAICILLLVQCIGFQREADSWEKRAKVEKVTGESAVKVAVVDTTKKVTDKVTKEMEKKNDDTLQESYKLLETVRNLKMIINNLEEINGVVGASGEEKPGGSDTSLQNLDHRKWGWIARHLAEKKELALEEEARGKRVGQVNTYLAGSPLSGLGECIVSHADRTGVNFALCPAIATAESSKGRVTCGSFNAWGMLGCDFSNWEHGVQRFFDNIVENTWWAPYQTAYNLQQEPYPYCVLNDGVTPSPTWGPNVQGQVDHIMQIQP